MPIRIVFFCFILITTLSPDIVHSSFDKEAYHSIKVVLDDNYPPYSFRDKDNQLQGISIDRWRLWEQTMGVNVILIGMDWNKALEFFQTGNADVIDTVFKNPERERIFSFGKPYAKIDVPIFVHKNIQGISDINKLYGFTIGVKKGDAVISILKAKGIHSFEMFDNYESLIKAVKNRRIWVFSVDKPSAYYLLHKIGISDEIMETEILYTGNIHIAVLKGNEHLLNIIEQGYDLLDKTELEKINEKWLGKPIKSPLEYKFFIYLILGLVSMAGLLFVWNTLLRKAVAKKTSQLSTTLESLRSSQRNLILLNFAIDSSYDMVFRINKRGIIEYVNTTTCKKLNYQYDELIGKNISDLTSKQKRILDILERFNLIEKINLELEFYDKDGKPFLAYLTLSSFDYEGNFYIYAFVRDISDIKALQNEMIKKEKIESLSILAGGIAHDFNNLLTIIIGNLSLLRIKFAQDDDTLALIDKTDIAAEKAKDLTVKLLTFSKGGSPIKETASLKHIVNETVSFALTGTKVKCEVIIDEDIRDVEVDVTQIHQVLHNLIINAIQSMSHDGKITIRASNHYIDEQSRLPLSVGEYVKIEVSDTGKGIDKEHLKRIFDPYFTTKQEGSGLGLAIVYSIINRHDGHISVESEVNKGTTFYIYLPASQNR